MTPEEISPEECQRKWELPGDHPESWIQENATYRMIWERAIAAERDRACQAIQNHRGLSDDEKRITIAAIRGEVDGN